MAPLETSSSNLPKRITQRMQDPQRLRALHNAQVLNSETEEIFDRLTRAANDLLGTPLALISFVDADNDFIKSQVGLPEPYASRRRIDANPTFCQLTVTQNQPLAINDAAAVPTLRLFPSVSEMGVRAHLGIPLIFEGQPIGNCCVIDFKPRQWTQANIDALTNLAALAMAEVTAKANALPSQA